MNSRIRRPLLLRSDVGSEQQHNQDLREIYKGERVLEFITFYQNALHLTTFFLPECIAFNHAECTAVPFTKMHRATTLGARDFSSAVSGFSQVFIVTRAKSGFGQHRKFPPHERKTSGTQGIAPRTTQIKTRWKRASFAAQTQSFLWGKFSTARWEVLTNLRHAVVFQISTMVNLGIGFQFKSPWLIQVLNLTRRWTFALRLRNTGNIQIPAC